MVDSDAVKRLLRGEIEPSEVEGDPALYSMAERIYGREGLEELGVFAPEVVTVERPELAEMSDEVSLPDFQPDISDFKLSEKSQRPQRRLGALFFGVTGILGTLFNMTIGAGAVLCSSGLANMKQVCNDDYGQTKLVWTEGFTWDGLHQIDSWVEPMTSPLIGDIAFLFFFATMALIGLFWKKKLVHSGDMLSLGS